MPKIEIKRVIFSMEASSLREAVLQAVAAKVSLRGAYLEGVDLSGADLSGVDFEGADLSASNLRQAKLTGANLKGTDLRGSDLREVQFGLRSGYGGPPTAMLHGADLSGAFLPDDVPKVSDLDAKVYQAIQNGTLNMREWHTCETTHCRAGWAITLAGIAGRNLERQYGPEVAGTLIYTASTGRKHPNFFAKNEEAMADIKACAGISDS